MVVDAAKHGLRLSNHTIIRPDLLVDSHEPDRAVDIIRANTKGQVRFGLDTRGKETASHLLRALSPNERHSSGLSGGVSQTSLSPPGTPDGHLARGHMIGMSGLPKQVHPGNMVLHSVPIKLYHEVKPVGLALCHWLGRLLEQGYIFPPDIVGIERGLESINSGLDRMRKGEISGGKLVVQVTQASSRTSDP